MRQSITLLFLLLFSFSFSQNNSYSGQRLPDAPLIKRIDFALLPEISSGIKLLEIHQPHFKSVDHLKQNLYKGAAKQHKKAASAPMPQVKTGFAAQLPSGTPLDNNIAISNNGKIVSVVNTTFRVYDTTGKMLYARSLAAIANELGTLNRTFDPKIVYDQEADKFILVFLNGSDHTNTSIVVGFSESDDPAGAWNFYSIDGNIGSEEWWSDYPFIGISKNELFITVLLWKDNETGWDTDAIDENIWQINKADGYEGKNLRQAVYNGIKGNGKQLWNTRPVGGGDQLYGPDFYLLGNRPKDINNDTFFLLHISGEIDDANRKLEVKPVVSSLAYGLQPNATQKGGRRLRTNYCDIHAGIRMGEQLLFVGNSIDNNTGRGGIYVGSLKELSTNPTLTGQIVAYDSLDLNYPNIAYAGAGLPDFSAMVVCLHNSANSFPGTSAFFIDRNFETSDLLRIKEGEGEMNILLSDSLERWGDYTGIHRDYSKNGSVWLAGSFGRSTNGTSQTWIANLVNADPALSTNVVESTFSAKVYPNPSRFFQVEFETLSPDDISIKLISTEGKIIYSVTEKVSIGKNQLSLSLDNIANLPGLMILEIRQGQRIVLTEKLIVSDY